MKWIIDRFEENIVILENEETKQKKEVEKSILPLEIKEGSILIEHNHTYFLDVDSERKKRKEIEEKFKRLRNNS